MSVFCLSDLNVLLPIDIFVVCVDALILQDPYNDK